MIRFAEARAIASTGIDLLGLPGVEPPAGLIERLRSFDSIVSWYGSNRAEFREQVRELGLPFQFLEALPEAGAKIHAADFFLRQAGGDGLAVPRIECERGGRGDFAVIHPFSGSARKNWPLERFREVGRAVGAAGAMVRRAPGDAASDYEDAVRFENLVRTGVLARERAGLHRQRFRDHASGGGGGDASGRDLWTDRSGGVGAAGRASVGAERWEFGRDRGG